jgi:hypothetical protein
MRSDEALAGRQQILPCISDRTTRGKILFSAGDPGDALYIVARGTVDVLANGMRDSQTPGEAIAQLGVGQAFGEMSLLSGGPRTATIRAAEDTDLMKIGKKDFDQLVAADRQLADAVQQISHQRAISNLSAGGTDAALWAKVASRRLDHLNRLKSRKMLKEAANGAGMAIVFGNILDTILGCLVIGAKFTAFGNLSLTLMLGMFLGGIPEAAASASMLTKAGYRPAAIFDCGRRCCWRRGSGSRRQAFDRQQRRADGDLCRALAGGAVLALVAHAMIRRPRRGGSR